MQTYMKSLTPFFICLLFLFPSVSSAQVFTGGSASFSFLNNRTYLEASPLIGYRINDFRLGTGAILSYNRRNGNERTHMGRGFLASMMWLRGSTFMAKWKASIPSIPALQVGLPETGSFQFPLERDTGSGSQKMSMQPPPYFTT